MGADLTGVDLSKQDFSGSAARVLASAIEILALHGEAGLRVTDVADQAGVSVGTIYTHFESRDGLIEASFAAQYRSQIGEDLMPLHRVIGKNCTQDDVLNRLLDAARLESASDPEGSHLSSSRLSRAEAVGASRRRPGLAREIELENRRIADIEVAAAREGQKLGLLNPNLDPEVLVALLQVFLFGLALLDANNFGKALSDEWSSVVSSFAQVFLSGPA
jgi:AcrR family transcriptional regulator